MDNIFAKFRLNNDKENYVNVIESIESGIVFRGTNLWVLIFAIFVASLGLNVNSTAVIIGAMLISPLMGPIMGVGLGMGINDVGLLRKSIYNYLVATIVALSTSTIFFLLSPLSDAHSEILARTSPNIYDVLIAFFGGLAGILATSSKFKGNVIPGVAIATALMPPLCTAGYGLATLQFSFFFGAFYLYIINTVFIALATLLIVRFLKFPIKQLQTKESEARAKRIIWIVVMLTLIPSLYFGYDIVKQNRFTNDVTRFITNEAYFENDYLLSKKIDAKNQAVTLVFGGKEISQKEIDELKGKLKSYNLEKCDLEIKQGFAYLSQVDKENTSKNDQYNQLTDVLSIKDQQLQLLQKKSDSISDQLKTGSQVYKELKVQYPGLKYAVIEPSVLFIDSAKTKPIFLVIVDLQKNISQKEKIKIQDWLQVRLHQDSVAMIFK
ncbi:MAG: TIGR00341 family protein [Ferruginibacter sp.]